MDTPEGALVGTVAWVHDVLAAYRKRGVAAVISPEDDMHNDADPTATARYFYVGLSALETILDALLLARKTQVTRILDLPCGFGRVLRHLRAAFPDAELHACDLYDNRIQFCGDVLGAVPVKSKEKLSDLQLPASYDLIWCGSLLTHLPEGLFEEAFRLMCRSLAPEGVAVITVHGRYVPLNQRTGVKYLADELFIRAERGFYRTGFGYADYHTPDIYTDQSDYGISISAPSYVLRLLEDDDSISVLSYQDRAWDDHHDVVVIGKRSVNHRWSWPGSR